jgi:ribosomal protein S20
MNSKSSKVVVVTVSSEQFETSLNDIRVSGNSAKAAMITACKFVAQATNYKDQQAARKALVKAYKAFQDSINLKPITLDAAGRWVARSVKALSGDDKFKWLTSTGKSATKSRKARTPKTTAPATTAPATTAPAEKLTSIEQYRNAIIAKENEIKDNYRNLIPEGKRKDFEEAFTLFIANISLILK